MSSGCNKKIIKWRSPGASLVSRFISPSPYGVAHEPDVGPPCRPRLRHCPDCDRLQAVRRRTGARAADAGAPTAATPAGDKVAAQITGAGATFVYPLMSKWSADYNKATGAKVNYQSIGSGGGIAQIKAGTVDFGSSDKPLTPEELAAAGLGQFPSAIGGVVPVVNVRRHRAGQAAPDRPAARRHLPRQGHDAGTTRRSPRSIRA